MFASLIFMHLVSILMALPLFGISMEDMKDLLSSNPENIELGFLRLLQVSQTIGLFIIPAVILNSLVLKKEDDFLHNQHSPSVTVLAIILLTLLLSMPLITVLINWNNNIAFPGWMNGLEMKLREMETERQQLTEQMLDRNDLADYLFNLFMIAVLPAIGEEFFFRGVLQRLMIRGTGNIHFGVLIAAVFFSAFHMQFFGFIPRLILGLYFGYLFDWSRNIWVPVLAHFLNNAIAVSLEYIADKGDYNDQLEHLGSFQSMWLTVTVSVILTTLLIKYSRDYLLVLKKR